MHCAHGCSLSRIQINGLLPPFLICLPWCGGRAARLFCTGRSSCFCLMARKPHSFCDVTRCEEYLSAELSAEGQYMCYGFNCFKEQLWLWYITAQRLPPHLQVAFWFSPHPLQQAWPGWWDDERNRRIFSQKIAQKIATGQKNCNQLPAARKILVTE